MAGAPPDVDDPAAMVLRRATPLSLFLVVALLAACNGSPAIDASQAGHAATAPSSVAPAPATREPAVDPPSSDAVPASIEPDLPAAPVRTVEATGGFRLERLASASCTAEGPADWTMTAPDRSDRADVLSPDGSRYAGYGIQAINTALQVVASEYAPPLNDPALYSEDPATVAAAYGQIIVSSIGGVGDLVVEEAFELSGGYLLLSVAGSSHRGGIFVHGSGYPGDGYNYSYALPMYFAFTTHDQWDAQGLLTARVAASIRCSTQFQPPDDYITVEAADPGAGDDPNGDDHGYNPQLGTEYANDPNTGENYLVDPSVNWSETGPDGPGYYVQKGGGDYQKLAPGRID